MPIITVVVIITSPSVTAVTTTPSLIRRSVLTFICTTAAAAARRSLPECFNTTRQPDLNLAWNHECSTPFQIIHVRTDFAGRCG